MGNILYTNYEQPKTPEYKFYSFEQRDAFLDALKRKRPLEEIKRLYTDSVDARYTDLEGKNFLFFAGYDISVIQFLIKKGCNPLQKDRYGSTILFFAENEDVVFYLVNNIAIDLKAVDINGETFLSRVKITERLVKKCIERGLVLDDIDGLITKFTSYEDIETLIKGGYNVNAIDNKGTPLFFHFLGKKHLQLFASENLNVCVKDSKGRTALDFPESRDKDTSTFLIKHGYYINTRSELETIYKYAQKDVIRYITNNNINKNVFNHFMKQKLLERNELDILFLCKGPVLRDALSILGINVDYTVETAQDIPDRIAYKLFTEDNVRNMFLKDKELSQERIDLFGIEDSSKKNNYTFNKNRFFRVFKYGCFSPHCNIMCVHLENDSYKDITFSERILSSQEDEALVLNTEEIKTRAVIFNIDFPNIIARFNKEIHIENKYFKNNLVNIKVGNNLIRSLMPKTNTLILKISENKDILMINHSNTGVIVAGIEKQEGEFVKISLQV